MIGTPNYYTLIQLNSDMVTIGYHDKFAYCGSYMSSFAISQPSKYVFINVYYCYWASMHDVRKMRKGVQNYPGGFGGSV